MEPSVITYNGSIARNRIKLIEKMGITHYPVCIAKKHNIHFLCRSKDLWCGK